MNLNPNSLTVVKGCLVEPELGKAESYDRFQFVRNGFFCADCHDSKPGARVLNRVLYH